MKKKTSFMLFYILPVLLLLFTSCSKRLESINKTKIALGTYVQINIVVKKGKEQEAKSIIDKAFSRVEKYDQLFDYRSQKGELCFFNKKKYIQKSSSPLLFSLISESLKLAYLTEGYFDPTVLPLVEVWGFNNKSPHLPQEVEVENALQRVGFQNVKLLEDIIIKPEDVKFDLSGIAKGKIVDLIRDFFIENGVINFLINAGGDIYIRGKNAEGKNWRIAIQDPDNPDRYVGVVEKSNIAIVTSGDYERFFIKNGKRYSHLLNPKTGYPDSNMRSVTVVSSETAFADAIATAVFIMGGEKGYNFLIENGIEGFIIYNSEQGKIIKKSTPDFWN